MAQNTRSVASNALAASEHTSRLLVNVAPYFLEPPRSQRAYLNSNVLVRCRAGGQPSPQIRWRKLVPVGSPPSSAQSSTSVLGGGGGGPATLKAVAPSSGDFEQSQQSGQQVATAAQLQTQKPISQQQQQQLKEFRIITSNSHIQILENGSMIIKELELADASRYSCQASNGINPSLSEVIDLSVLSECLLLSLHANKNNLFPEPKN